MSNKSKKKNRTQKNLNSLVLGTAIVGSTLMSAVVTDKATLANVYRQENGTFESSNGEDQNAIRKTVRYAEKRIFEERGLKKIEYTVYFNEGFEKWRNSSRIIVLPEGTTLEKITRYTIKQLTGNRKQETFRDEYTKDQWSGNNKYQFVKSDSQAWNNEFVKQLEKTGGNGGTSDQKYFYRDNFDRREDDENSMYVDVQSGVYDQAEKWVITAIIDKTKVNKDLPFLAAFTGGGTSNYHRAAGDLKSITRRDVISDNEEAADAREKVEAAEAAATAAANKKAEIEQDKAISQAEKDALDNLIQAANTAKAEAEAAVNALPEGNSNKATLTQRKDAIQIPSTVDVNDADGNGKVDEEERAEADAREKVVAKDKVKEAYDAKLKEVNSSNESLIIKEKIKAELDKDLIEAIKAIDNAITTEEVIKARDNGLTSINEINVKIDPVFINLPEGKVPELEVKSEGYPSIDRDFNDGNIDETNNDNIVVEVVDNRDNTENSTNNDSVSTKPQLAKTSVSGTSIFSTIVSFVGAIVFKKKRKK